MKYHSTLMGLGLIATLPVFSQQTLPYYCDFDEQTQETIWEEYRLGSTQDLFYTWEFENNELVHYYPVGGTEVTDDWFVSPEFDFSNGAMIDSISHSFGGFGTPQVGDTIMIYVITGSADPELATDIMPLHLLSDENYEPDNVWRTTAGIEIPAISGESHIAFRYKTINNWLDVRIDDLYISGGPVGILNQGKPLHTLHVFPNPANDVVQFSAEEVNIESISVMDITGRRVMQKSQFGNGLKIEISNLPEGIYILSAKIEDGTIYTQKFVVSR